MVIRIIFFIGDTHFYQDKLLQYNKRPFKSIEEMNSEIVKNWNNVIKDDDIVYVLGDFSFGTIEETKEICHELKGIKYLIKGNWDKFKFEKTWEEIGFEKVLEEPCELYITSDEPSKHPKKIVLSHHPVDISSDEVNIHAHLHSDDLKMEYPNMNPKNHFCISVERIEYTPIQLEKIIKI